MKRIFAWFFMATITLVSPAWAYIDLSLAPELSFAVHFDKAEFQQETKKYRATPDGNRLLSYSVRLPKGWKEHKILDISNSSSMLNDVGYYRGPYKLDSYSYFRVASQKIDKSISAEHWFVNYLMAYHYTLDGYRRVNEWRVEGQYIHFSHGKTFYVRVNIMRNGSRIILTEYAVPYAQWNKEMSFSIWSSLTFKLNYLEGSVMGAVATQAFLDVANFSYPLNWKVRYEEINSLDVMRVEMALVKKSEYVDKRGRGYSVVTDDGTMLVSLVSNYENGEIIRERRLHMKRIKEQGFEFGEPTEVTEELIFGDGFELISAKVHPFAAVNTKKFINYEMWMIELKYGGYNYIISMVTPARLDVFNVWSDNIGTLKLVLSSMKPGR